MSREMLGHLFLIALGSFVVHKLGVIQDGQWTILERLETALTSHARQSQKPIAWVRGQKSSSDYLYHVKTVFRRLGYTVVEGDEVPSKWDVFWCHEYPFSRFKIVIEGMSDHQLVNHIPGTVYYTSKVILATSGLSKGIPKSFEIPRQKKEFLDYSKRHPEAMWVQKSNDHRGIKVLPSDKLELDKEDTFIQQFIRRPLLVDGKKFDLGVYVVVTSVSPLRVYIYEDEILLRFCPKEHEPFDANDLDKYVVADDYTPIWEMPSFNMSYNINHLSFKNSLAVHLEKKGQSIDVIMSQIKDIIKEVFEKLNPKMRTQLSALQQKDGYFELSRFDFLVDEEMFVYLMEANMSPNLSSGHFKPNAALYEQVLMNLFSLVGVGQSYRLFRNDVKSELSLLDVEAPERALNLPINGCESECGDCPASPRFCGLCPRCLSSELRGHLARGYLEHLWRREMRRVIPSTNSVLSTKSLPDPSSRPSEADSSFKSSESSLTALDHLQSLWFQQKCKADRSWCA